MNTKRTMLLPAICALSALLISAACTGNGGANSVENAATADSRPKGSWPAAEQPGSEPALFAAGFINTGMAERDTTIAPDGSEIWFSVQHATAWALVRTRKLDDGTWSEPQVVPFSGQYRDVEPAFSPDGQRLYFASDRPRADDTEERRDFDLWYVERREEGWGEPQHTGNTINTSGNEFYPSVTSEGVLYWTAVYNDDENIHKALPVGDGWGERITLGPEINTPGMEFNAWIAPDESMLLFSSFKRPDGLGGGDLYVSFRREDGTWTQSQNLGEAINSPSLDYCPSLSPDGSIFFFTSRRGIDLDEDTALTYELLMKLHNSPGNGKDDIYWMSAQVLETLRGEAMAQ